MFRKENRSQWIRVHSNRWNDFGPKITDILFRALTCRSAVHPHTVDLKRVVPTRQDTAEHVVYYNIRDDAYTFKVCGITRFIYYHYYIIHKTLRSSWVRVYIPGDYFIIEHSLFEKVPRKNIFTWFLNIKKLYLKKKLYFKYFSSLKYF